MGSLFGEAGTEISDLPNRQFKTVVVQILTEVRRAMHEERQNFSKRYKIYLKNNPKHKSYG